MNSYMVFVKSSKKFDKFEDLILLKNGFNIYAALFNIAWLIFKQCYLFSLASILFITIAKTFFSAFSFAILYILLCILLGFESDNILINNFKRNKQYIFVGIIMGNTEDEAKLNFLEEMSKEKKDEEKIIF